MKNPINLLLLCLASLLFLQCKSENSTVDPNADRTLPSKVIDPKESKAQYEANPNTATASKYITDVIKTALDSSTPVSEKKSLLNSGLEVANSLNEKPMRASLLNTYLKTIGPKEDPSKAFDLGKLLQSMKKSSAANILFYGYSKLDVTPEQATKATQLIDTPIPDVEEYIATLRKKISENPTRYSLNEVSAREYVDACEAYAMVMPDNPETPTHLFNAAEVAKSLKSFNKSFALFDWLIEKYPNHNKTPTALFLKGFILENELNNDNGAKVFYEEFLEKYPTHDLADDVEFLIGNLGKSDEEILKMIEGKQIK